jgi:sortase B
MDEKEVQNIDAADHKDTLENSKKIKIQNIDPKKNMKKRLLNMIIAAAICIIAYSTFSFFSIQHQYQKSGQEYERVKKKAGADKLGLQGLDDTLPEIDLKSLQKENPDTKGWIYYPVLGINYPIMQDKDNTFYIKHTFSGDKNAAGSVFLDCYGNPDFMDDNTYIFGHNMKNGSMFGRIKEIRKEDTVKDNPYFWIYTEEEWKKYQIFSYHDANADKKDIAFQIEFENKQAFQKFIKDVTIQSEEKLDVEVKDTDKIVSLSTCTSNSSLRLVVHGVLVK